ncbi:hypothetical protein [Neobacillus sp. LXY-4]|uniref:hypothetical protein n=1 Tax=Neobacillus sp. LXY-4 TaxID=3379826 RepID=UPI003EDFA810
MFKRKEELLREYYHLSLLLNEMNPQSIDPIQRLLDEREQCITEVNRLDRVYGRMIMNPVIKEQLIKIIKVDRAIKEKLQAMRQSVLAEYSAVKKEQTIKHHYGEPSVVNSGFFYDKRK